MQAQVPGRRDSRVADEMDGTGLPWLYKMGIRSFFMREREMNQKGLTLIELVVVMVIIAIGATLMATKHWRLDADLPSERRHPGRGLHDAGCSDESGLKQYLVPRLF